MTVTVFNTLSVDTWISDGPFLDTKNFSKIFSSKNALGSVYAMEIHTSINGLYRYGSITVFDKEGARESLPLTGNEILTVAYKNAARNDDSSTPPMIIHFNIFDIEERPFNEGINDQKRFTAKYIKFHVIEAPFFLAYNSTLWQKGFGKDKGTNDTNDKVFLNKIYEDHITKDLKIVDTTSDKNLIGLNLQKMSTKMHFLIPSWKSQQTFMYLLDFCRDENGYGNVKFYNTTDVNTGKIIINLQSLNNMFKNSKKTIRYTQLDDASLRDSKKIQSQINNRQINQIIDYKFVFYDLSSITSSLAGGYMLNFDYANSQYYTLYDSYENSNSKKENPYFSNFALWRNDISNENGKQYNLGSFPRLEAKKYLNNKIIKNKHQLRCEIMTYVDEQIQPGDKISVSFVSGMISETKELQTHLFDEHMSDEWIVEEVIDSYENGNGTRKMTIVKDSFFNIYEASAGSDTSKSALPQIKYVNGNTL